MRAIAWVGFLWGVAAAAAPAQRLSPPLGHQVRVRVSGGERGSGELLAVDRDTLWLLQSHAVIGVPLSEGLDVRVDRGGMGSGGALIWAVAVGVASGTALTAACSSVDGANCGAVFVGTVALWTLVGALSGRSLEKSRYLTLTNPQAEQLRPRARFPQGLPTRVRDSLVPGKPAAP